MIHPVFYHVRRTVYVPVLLSALPARNAEIELGGRPNSLLPILLPVVVPPSTASTFCRARTSTWQTLTSAQAWESPCTPGTPYSPTVVCECWLAKSQRGSSASASGERGTCKTRNRS